MVVLPKKNGAKLHASIQRGEASGHAGKSSERIMAAVRGWGKRIDRRLVGDGKKAKMEKTKPERGGIEEAASFHCRVMLSHIDGWPCYRADRLTSI